MTDIAMFTTAKDYLATTLTGESLNRAMHLLNKDYLMSVVMNKGGYRSKNRKREVTASIRRLSKIMSAVVLSKQVDSGEAVTSN